jgi:acetyl-CoA carboxylase carboxyltransferase component
MGPEGLVAIGARKLLQGAESPEAAAAMKAELAKGLREQISIYRTAAMAMVDDVVDPRDTRKLLARTLARAANKKVERPYRKREVSPV